MAITFHVDDWRAARAEMEWLWPLHWDEVAMDKDHMRFDLDINEYETYADRGFMHCIIARDEGKVIGYHWSIVRMHLHYKTVLCAFQDVYFLHPDYRKGMNGVNLFRFAEDTLKARGVKKLYGAHKIKLDIGDIFYRLGWSHAENHYTKYIGVG